MKDYEISINKLRSSGFFTEDPLKDSSNLGKGYLREGELLRESENTFSIQVNGKKVGKVKIFPSTVRYEDVISGQTFRADLYKDSDHPRKEEVRTEKANMSDYLPLDISAIASDIASVKRERVKKRQTESRNPNLKERAIMAVIDEGTKKTVRDIETSRSLKQLIRNVFNEINELSLIDVGSGFGEFPLEIAKISDFLGISSITASDLNVSLMDERREDLLRLGVEIKEIDAKQMHKLEERYDLVTLNAPQAYGENAFAEEAIRNSFPILNTPGLLLLRMDESSDDVTFKPEWGIPKDYPTVKFRKLEGLPNSAFSKGFFQGTPGVYVALKPEQASKNK